MALLLLTRQLRSAACPLRLCATPAFHSSTAAASVQVGGSVKPPGQDGGQGPKRTEAADSQHDPDIIQNLKDTQGKAGTATGGSHSEPDVRSPLSEAAQGDAGDERGGHPRSSSSKSPPDQRNANPQNVTGGEGDTGTTSTTEKVGDAQRLRSPPSGIDLGVHTVGKRP